MRCKIHLLMSLMVILLAACADPTPSGDFLPIVDDPDYEINVTPQSEQEFAYFKVVVTRIGKQAPNIGWFANGEVDLKVALDVDGPLNVVGTGFGTAGYDASPVCINKGGWPAEYTAEGYFDVDNCEFNIKIEETWPKTEAITACGAYGGGIYQLAFPSLKFSETDPREDTTTSKDKIDWVNTFLLYAKDGLEDSGCVFNDPAP